jgi:hypothetical protein
MALIFFPYLPCAMSFYLILHLLFSIQSSHQHQGDSLVSRSIHRDTNSLQDVIKTKDEILAIHDMEESPCSSYHVHHQYMKDLPHISVVSTNIIYLTSYFVELSCI